MKSLDEALKELEVAHKELRWCDECGTWHKGNALTMCMLREARDVLSGRTEDKAPTFPNPKRPWKRIKK